MEGAAVGMDDELVGPDVLTLAALRDQHFGQGGALLPCQQPTHHIATEDIQQHVEVVVGPLHRAQELGDVSASNALCADLALKTARRKKCGRSLDSG
jgi:hypothetical protein